MSAKNLILVGGGGHCRSCIEVINSGNVYNITGVIDNHRPENFQYTHLGNDSIIPELAVSAQNYFLITVGQIRTATKRRKVFDHVRDSRGKFATVISPYSIISDTSCINEGSIIFHNVLVNANTNIGRNVIINNKSLIEHDCIIGDHCHISTGAILNGGCFIGNEVLIGSNSVVIQGISIASNVIIGAGSVVIKDIKDPGVYAGNPVRKISDDSNE